LVQVQSGAEKHFLEVLLKRFTLMGQNPYVATGSIFFIFCNANAKYTCKLR
jgi:hypothetical protein